MCTRRRNAHKHTEGKGDYFALLSLKKKLSFCPVMVDFEGGNKDMVLLLLILGENKLSAGNTAATDFTTTLEKNN